MKIRKKRLILILIYCCLVQISFAQKSKKKEDQAKVKTENIKVRPAVEKARQVELKNLAYWLIGLQIVQPINTNYTELYTGRIDETKTTSEESTIYLKNMYGHTLYKIKLKYNGKFPDSGNIYKPNKPDSAEFQSIESCRFALEYNKNKLIEKIQCNNVEGQFSEYIFKYDDEKQLISIDLKTASNIILQKASITNNNIDTLFDYNNSKNSAYNNLFIHKYNRQQQITLIEKRDKDSTIHSSSYIRYNTDSITPLYIVNSAKTSRAEDYDNYVQDIVKYNQFSNKIIQSAFHYNTKYANTIDFGFLDFINQSYSPSQLTYKYNKKNECISITDRFYNQCTTSLTNTIYILNKEGFVIKIEKTSKIKNRCRN